MELHPTELFSVFLLKYENLTHLLFSFLKLELNIGRKELSASYSNYMHILFMCALRLVSMYGASICANNTHRSRKYVDYGCFLFKKKIQMLKALIFDALPLLFGTKLTMLVVVYIYTCYQLKELFVVSSSHLSDSFFSVS